MRIRPFAAAVALAGSFGVAGSASAGLIWSGVLNLTIPNTGTGLYVNMVDGTTYTGPATFPVFPGPGSNYDFNIFGTTSWSVFNPGTSGQAPPTPVPVDQKGYMTLTSGGPVANLNVNDVIGPAQLYNTASPSAAAIVTGQPAIFGLRFRNENDVNNPNDDTVHFGWVKVILVNGQPGTMVEYAWDDTPMTPVLAGIIPEPTGAALLAVATLPMLRRRR